MRAGNVKGAGTYAAKSPDLRMCRATRVRSQLPGNRFSTFAELRATRRMLGWCKAEARSGELAGFLPPNAGHGSKTSSHGKPLGEPSA